MKQVNEKKFEKQMEFINFQIDNTKGWATEYIQPNIQEYL